MKFLKKLLSSLFVLALTLLFADTLLRFIPSPVQYPPWHEIGDPNSIVGIEIVPSTKAVERSACAVSEITTNALGWRDKERSLKKTPELTRIAVLGDSFIEGSQVNDDQIFTRQLEKILGDKFEVLNFGLSSIGTVQESILYEKLVKKFDPDIVITAFYLNDVQNNDPVLEGGPGKNTPLAYLDENGNIIRFSDEKPFYAFRKWLRIQSPLFRLVKAVYGRLNGFADKYDERTAASTYPKAYSAYGEPETDDWRRAWNTTEGSFLALKKETEPEKKFFMMLVPGMLEVAPDPARLIRSNFGEKYPPSGFDPQYPRNRLLGFAQKNGIDVIDPQLPMVKYIAENNLEYPYFSYTCDGHLNPLGLKLLAEEAATIIR